jgi:hypothetical protein
MQISEILLRNNQFPIVEKHNIAKPSENMAGNRELVTVLANFAYYGYTPSLDGISLIASLSIKELASFWKDFEVALKSVTGDKFKVGEHVLYKNFPKEVLNMDESEYWLRQIFVYLGFPFSFVAQEAEKREPIGHELKLKVLEPAASSVPVFNKLVSQKTRWTTVEEEMMLSLANEYSIGNEEGAVDYLDLASYGFKENGIFVFTNAYNNASIEHIASNEGSLGYSLNKEQLQMLDYLKKSVSEGTSGKVAEKSVLEAFKIKDATDVVRLALSLSGQDIRFSVAKFKNFSRKDRRALLSMLENTNNLIEDVSERPLFFKRLIQKLHPGDFNKQFPNTKKAYHLLYNDKTISFNARLEGLISGQKKEALDVASERPGVFLRKFHELYSLFGSDAVISLSNNVDKLTVDQLLKLKGYVENINDRKTLMYPPKGNWGRVQLDENKKITFKLKDNIAIQTIINNSLSQRLLETFETGFNVDSKLKKAKLPTNDQEVGDYGRGTEFDIPENINFVRTSSYWNSNRGSFVDNTWNFFDESFNEVGVCCWNATKAGVGKNTYSVFSGDATNQATGKAAQLVDLYFEEMEKAGVRYAVWSILSYSNILFSDFDELHAGLQFGETPNGGALFEPSRVALSFELKGKALTKVVAYLDVKERKLVFMDVNFNLSTQSGQNNGKKLSELVPPYMEYLDSIPSYYDLLSTSHDENGIPAVYDSKDLVANESSEDENNVEKTFFTFIHLNTMLKGNRLNLSDFLSSNA